MVALRLLAVVDEIGPDQQHTIVNLVRSPGGEVIGEGKAEFSAEGQTARPDFLMGIILPLGVRFEATEEGSYAVEFNVDEGALSTTLPIHVVHGAP